MSHKTSAGANGFVVASAAVKLSEKQRDCASIWPAAAREAKSKLLDLERMGYLERQRIKLGLECGSVAEIFLTPGMAGAASRFAIGG